MLQKFWKHLFRGVQVDLTDDVDYIVQKLIFLFSIILVFRPFK